MKARAWVAVAAAAASLGAGSIAWAQSAAERAVEAAKQYAGEEISIVWEAGLQSLDPLNFSGPKWEELTGIEVKVIEVPTAEMFTKILQEHRAGTGAYDALNVIPSWMPDLVKAGALEELDPYVDKYGYRAELENIAPTYRDNQMKVDGKIYGFPDDGDLFVLYYRKDLFEDAENQAEFKAKHGYDLGRRKPGSSTPTPAGSSPTSTRRRSTAPGSSANPPTASGCSRNATGWRAALLRPGDHAGADQQRDRRQGVRGHALGQRLHAAGGGDVGLRRGAELLPRRRHRDDHLLAAVRALGGRLRYGGRGAVVGAQVHHRRQRWVIPCRRAGRRSSRPGSRSPSPSSSKNKEAAYLFIQWLNSEETSLQRVQLPYALRDPFRESHFTNANTSRAGRMPTSIWPPFGPGPTPACSTSRSCRSTSTRRPCASR